MILRVLLPNTSSSSSSSSYTSYLVDVGFGGATLTVPIILEREVVLQEEGEVTTGSVVTRLEACEQETPHETFRLIPTPSFSQQQQQLDLEVAKAIYQHHPCLPSYTLEVLMLPTTTSSEKEEEKRQQQGLSSNDEKKEGEEEEEGKWAALYQFDLSLIATSDIVCQNWYTGR